MFRLNEIIETKSGEKLKPFLVQKGMVYCSTRSGEMVMRKLEDFDFTPKPKEKEVVIVTPIMETTDEFYEVPDEEPTEEITEEPTVSIPDEDYI